MHELYVNWQITAYSHLKQKRLTNSTFTATQHEKKYKISYPSVTKNDDNYLIFQQELSQKSCQSISKMEKGISKKEVKADDGQMKTFENTKKICIMSFT